MLSRSGCWFQLIVALCLGQANWAYAQSQPRYELRYKFRSQQVVHYEVVTSTEIATQFDTAADTAWNKSETRRHFQVLSVDAQGNGTLELTIDWVRMKAQAGSTTAVEEFCSDQPDKQPAKYRHILDRIGKPQATLAADAWGKPVKVVPHPQAPVMANKPVSLGAETTAESYLSPLPEHPVAIGEEWKERFEIPVMNAERLQIKIAMLRSYRLAEVIDGKARIDFRTTILSPVHDPSISAQLIQKETAGTILFDINNGLILSRTSGVDRTVISPFGEKTSLRATSKYQERLIQPGQVAGVPRNTPSL